MARVEVIINAASGSVFAGETEDAVRAAFSAQGIDANFRVAKTGAEIERFAAEAADGEAKVIVAGGGDGTISTVAKEVHRSGKILGVLPLGTLNNFAKDLGVPLGLEEAAGVVAANEVRSIDLAEVNGRVFLNNSSIGLYPQMVRRRVRQQRLGRGKWYAAFWAWLRVFRYSPFLKVHIKVGGKEFERKLPFVFVGNNEYEMDLYNIGRRNRLDSGKLSVYFIHRDGRWGVTLLLMHTIAGRLRQWQDFEEVDTEEVTIETRRRRLFVAVDGEVERLPAPLVYRCLPKSLRVIAPPSP
ncbi:MAG: diacylglycerol kinase family protein [Pyrinomonadaceae bacterium]